MLVLFGDCMNEWNCSRRIIYPQLHGCPQFSKEHLFFRVAVRQLILKGSEDYGYWKKELLIGRSTSLQDKMFRQSNPIAWLESSKVRALRYATRAWRLAWWNKQIQSFQTSRDQTELLPFSFLCFLNSLHPAGVKGKGIGLTQLSRNERKEMRNVDSLLVLSESSNFIKFFF